MDDVEEQEGRRCGNWRKDSGKWKGRGGVFHGKRVVFDFGFLYVGGLMSLGWLLGWDGSESKR